MSFPPITIYTPRYYAPKLVDTSSLAFRENRFSYTGSFGQRIQTDATSIADGYSSGTQNFEHIIGLDIGIPGAEYIDRMQSYMQIVLLTNSRALPWAADVSINMEVTSGGGTFSTLVHCLSVSSWNTFFPSPSNTSSLSFNIGSAAYHAFDPKREAKFIYTCSFGAPVGYLDVRVNFDHEFVVGMNVDQYKRYSVFIPSYSATESFKAVSENPLAILDDVFSHHTGLPYLQSVSSANQIILSNSGYKFHCFFAEPRASQEAVNEFGQLSATNFWMGDSGMLQSKVYVESASATFDETITPKDMAAFEIEENSPSERRAEQAANYTLQWGYNFQTEKYNNITIKNPSNNSFCNSMSALGVNKFFKLDTKYITDSATANYAANNFVRLMGQGSEIYRMKLGPWAMALELNDILKVQNPMIVGSEALAQITGLNVNLNTGTVSVVAEKLLEGP